MNDHDPHAFEYGVRAQFGNEEKGAYAIFNVGFENTFGQNTEEGTELNYGMMFRTPVTKHVAIGFDAFGSIENIGEAPGFKEQDHRIGPAIKFNFGDDDEEGGKKGDDDAKMAVKDKDPELDMNFAVLFVLTDSTPDTTFTWNFEVTF